jgi:hypothetical protein
LPKSATESRNSKRRFCKTKPFQADRPRERFGALKCKDKADLPPQMDNLFTAHNGHRAACALLLRGQPFGVQASLSQVSAADVTEFRKWLNLKKLLPVIRPRRFRTTGV